MEAKKPVREINVPDSVGTFRLDFDYSVFEKPLISANSQRERKSDEVSMAVRESLRYA